MQLVLFTTFAACTWLVLWAIGAKPFDAFLVAALIMIIGAAQYLIVPFLPGKRQED